MSSRIIEIMCRQQGVDIPSSAQDGRKTSTMASSTTSGSGWSPSVSGSFMSPIDIMMQTQDISVSVEAEKKPMHALLKGLREKSRNAVIQGLELTCDYVPYGCESSVKPEEKEDHMKRCPFNPDITLKCTKGCNATVRQASLGQHSCVGYLKGVIGEKEDVIEEKESKILELVEHNQRLEESVKVYENKVKELEARVLRQANDIRELKVGKVKPTVVPEEESSGPEISGREKEEEKKAKRSPSLVACNVPKSRGRGHLRRSLFSGAQVVYSNRSNSFAGCQ